MQEELFYEFSLEDHVPQSHLLRRIDARMDFSEVRAHLAPFYSSAGRPSIDPELMIRMLVVGYCLGIRSERRLCEEVHLNLAYRWFSAEIATAESADRIRIRFTGASNRLTPFISDLENIAVAPDRVPRVVINERTGTVVAGGDVTISSVVISQPASSIRAVIVAPLGLRSAAMI
jgi:hypothetical protein